jgi:hypothetical protein
MMIGGFATGVFDTFGAAAEAEPAKKTAPDTKRSVFTVILVVSFCSSSNIDCEI